MTQREKLIELIYKACEFRGEKYHGISSPLTVDQLTDYLLANCVIVLPCKVGDTVYAAEKAPVIPLSVKDIAVFLEGEEGSDYERIANFGKTVFLNREEAEAALKKMEERNERLPSETGNCQKDICRKERARGKADAS